MEKVGETNREPEPDVERGERRGDAERPVQVEPSEDEQGRAEVYDPVRPAAPEKRAVFNVYA